MPSPLRYATNEMTGVSFTFCELDDELEDLLFEPAHCAFDCMMITTESIQTAIIRLNKIMEQYAELNTADGLLETET